MNYNVSDIDVVATAEEHPYMTGIVVLIVLFVLGIFVAFAKTVKNGLQFICDCIYYLTAPIHMPFRWAYQRL